MTGKYTDGVGDRIERPWGSYEILAQGDGYQTKRILIRSGQRTSYQSHTRRAEVWIVVRGTARITVDEIETDHAVGEVVSIPIGAKHRLANSKTDDVILIETQTGTYLGEDDITRHSDDYGRLI